MKKYTVDEILKAAEIGEVSMIDARHIVSLLDEAREELIRHAVTNRNCFSCMKLQPCYFSDTGEQMCLVHRIIIDDPSEHVCDSHTPKYYVR